jgi:hypothetical protein
MNDGTQNIDHSTNEIKPQIMTFDIPLNDTSSAGLGITLKGKTSFVDGQSVDLGIFVKSILTGGAASRVNFPSEERISTLFLSQFRIIVFDQMINFLLLMIRN